MRQQAQSCTVLLMMQDLDKSLSDYGITSASRILVLKHADDAAKRAMDAASDRDTRMKRLRQPMALRCGSATTLAAQTWQSQLAECRCRCIR